MIVRSIQTSRIPIARQDILGLLDRFVGQLEEGSVLAITSKLVSICEGRFVEREAAQKQALIESEAEWFLSPGASKHRVILAIKDHRLIPSAGIDESNANDHYILWPSNAQQTANAVRSFLCERNARRHLGVVITDSTTAPLRSGVNGISLAHSGFKALNDYVGTPDLFGRPLRMTRVNVADALAVAAVLTMGEGNEQTPLAVLSDLPFVAFQENCPSDGELESLRIKPEDDLYAPLLQAVCWQTKGDARPMPKTGA
jgi:dihydrofolate synthase / folylpolyglutamate synthase